MRFLAKAHWPLAALLLATALVPPATSAKGFSGEPECPGQKEGTALTGAIHIQFLPTPVGSNADIVIRLRKAQQLETFFCRTTIANPDDPCVVLAAVTAACQDEIKAAFCDGACSLGLHGASEVGLVDSDDGLTRHLLADIVITVK